MSKKIALIIIAAVLISGISGCTDKSDGTNTTVKPELIPTTNLPAGFSYMGTHETTVDVGGTEMSATEGVYRYMGEDAYIQVIKNDSPENLTAQYKLRYKNVKYNPFEEISINGHKATKVTDYSTINGRDVPHYTVIWTKEDAMIIVSSSSADAQTVISLATLMSRQ